MTQVDPSNGNHIALEADDSDVDFPDTDSGLGDDMSLMSSTASLRSSVVRECIENGRKYHGYKDGKYVLPMDEEELARQESQYALCLATFGSYHLAPLTNLHRVLDVGCGVGFWTFDFAEKHPEAEVIGVDLTAVQPDYVPPNLQFEIDDLEEEWTFSYKFDYIHVMMMTGAFRDWPRFYQQAFQYLSPGGWVELQDIDFPLQCDDASLPPTSPLRRWSDLMMEAGRRAGFELDTCGRAGAMMRAAGFVDIVRVPYKWPLGPWARDPHLKRIGWWALENFTAGVESIMLALFTRFLGWSCEQVKGFAVEVAREYGNKSYHCYFNLYITYGRRPGPGEG